MYDNILLTIDLGDEYSWKSALPVAETLARATGAQLHAVTVLPSMGMSIVGSFLPDGAEQKALDLAKDKLKELLEGNVSDDISIKGHVAKGSIYQEIIRAADTLECELIVMTSHSPELKDYLLGPNAARVVRHARQSVHVVRTP